MEHFTNKKLSVGFIVFILIFSMQSFKGIAAPLYVPLPSITIDSPSNSFIG